jgi:hypothetical protein
MPSFVAEILRQHEGSFVLRLFGPSAGLLRYIVQKRSPVLLPRLIAWRIQNEEVE